MVSPTQAIAEKGSKTVYVTSTEQLGHTSVVVALACDGSGITPAIIFQGERPIAELGAGFPEAPFSMTPSGYQTQETFGAYMRRFVLESGATIDNPVVLIVDNHDSHLGLETLVFLKENGVRAVGMHPHTTHVLCGLDTSYFRVFKAAFLRAVAEFRAAGGQLTRYTMAGCIRTAYLASTAVTIEPLTGRRSSPIISGMAKTGVFPFNRNVLTDDAFAVSDALRAARDNLNPAAAAAAAAPPVLFLTAAERASIATSLLKTPLPVEAKIKAAAAANGGVVKLNKKGKPIKSKAQKAEMLICGEYLERRLAVETEKKEEEAFADEKRKAKASKSAKIKADKVAAAAARTAKKAAGPKPKKAPKPKTAPKKVSKPAAAAAAAVAE